MTIKYLPVETMFILTIFFYFFNDELQADGEDRKEDILQHINQMHATMLMPD